MSMSPPGSGNAITQPSALFRESCLRKKQPTWLENALTAKLLFCRESSNRFDADYVSIGSREPARYAALSESTPAALSGKAHPLACVESQSTRLPTDTLVTEDP